MKQNQNRQKITRQNYYSRLNDYARTIKDSTSFEFAGYATHFLDFFGALHKREIHLDHKTHNMPKNCNYGTTINCNTHWAGWGVLAGGALGATDGLSPGP